MNDNTIKSKRLAKNTFYMFFRMLLVVVVSFYTSRVILRVLGVDDYGIYNVVGSVVVFLSFFKNALQEATYRYLAYGIGVGDKEQLKKLFSMSLNTHVLLAVFLVIVIEIVGVWFINHKLNIPSDRLLAANWVFQFSLITFALEVIKTPFNSLIVAHERLSFYAITSIVEVVLKLAIVYLLQILMFDKLILYSILLTVVALIMFIWYIIYSYKYFEESHYCLYWDNKFLRELLSYSGWSIVVNAADVSVTQCINIFLNIFYGVAVNAAMGVANQVNAVMYNFLNSFATAFKPQIFKSYAAKEYEYFNQLIFSTSKYSFFLLFAVAFPVMLNINYLLEIWLESPPEMAGTFLICIACYSLFDSFSSPLWNAVYATGNLKVHQILMSSIKLLNIPIGYLLLLKGYPSYSILILYATLNAVCAIVRIFYLRFLIDLDVINYLKNVLIRIIIVVALSIMPALLVNWLVSSSFNKLLFTTLCFETIYGVALYFIGLNEGERSLLKHIFMSNIRK